ncbi:MAG: HEAT repeat domain-containing protein [Methanobacterium sp. ERen5]|nr:MAG: HEAT repeat domain-containing protein [Methanobacterium sp. ERen5]
MDEHKVKQINREKRGQITDEYLSQFEELADESIIQMLKDKNPQKRTAAAKILGKTPNSKNVAILCGAMKNEKALYSRIAMSESLGEMGEIAVPNLIDLLGMLGNNQERELPTKYFKKKNFPLQHDLAARTLVKVGRPALPYLIKTIKSTPDVFTKEQAADTIGGITYKTQDQSAVDIIIQTTLENINNPDNSVLLWKSVRALSGFQKNRKAFDVLMGMLEHETRPPILWETLRSLGKIGICNTQLTTFLKNFETENPEIKLAYDRILVDLKLYI